MPPSRIDRRVFPEMFRVILPLLTPNCPENIDSDQIHFLDTDSTIQSDSYPASLSTRPDSPQNNSQEKANPLTKSESPDEAEPRAKDESPDETKPPAKDESPDETKPPTKDESTG